VGSEGCGAQPCDAIVSRQLQGDKGTIIQDAHRGAAIPFAQLGEPQVDHASSQGDALGLSAIDQAISGWMAGMYRPDSTAPSAAWRSRSQ